MTRTMSQVKNVKGRESTTITQEIIGRNAACLGFAKVDPSGESDEMFGDMIYDKDDPAAAGVPTLVKMGQFDSNGKKTMKPIVGLVIEVIDVSKLPGAGDDKIVVNLEKEETLGLDGSKITLTKGEFFFDYNLCVHGLYLDGDNKLHTGPKILVPKKNLYDVSAYGIVLDETVGRALNHAIANEKLDLLYLWNAFKLVQGAKGLTKTPLDKEQKQAAKELFGSLDDAQVNNSFAEMYGDECYGALNATDM